MSVHIVELEFRTALQELTRQELCALVNVLFSFTSKSHVLYVGPFSGE